jgi:transposase
MKLAVVRILPDGTLERTAAFTRLVSHYAFKDRYGRAGRGNDKGNVEALVKFARNTFLTSDSALTITFHPRRRVL